MQTQVVVHRLDRFTKVTLVIIVCALILLLIKPFLFALPAIATPGERITVDLNIQWIGGKSIRSMYTTPAPIPLKITVEEE